MDRPSELFTRVCWTGREIRTDSSYFWDNDDRYHINQLVIQWTVSGMGFFQDGSIRHLVPAGYAMLFTYNEKTSYGYPSEATEPYELIAINLSPSLTLSPLFLEIREKFGPVVRMSPESHAASILGEILERYLARNFRDALHESELILGLFHSLYREQQQGSTKQDAVEYGYHTIRNHFRSPINLKTLAEKAGVSREHFIRTFTARYGESPGMMLRNLRLGHGRTLLLSTRISVQGIAHDCGFLSSSSFCRAYKNQFNRRPQDER